MNGHDEYELVDFGGGARLERFGDRLIDRPHPAALGNRRRPERWLDADLRFDRDRGWTGPAASDRPWQVTLEAVPIELRCTETGQVGLFPEHLAMLPWLRARTAERLATEGALEGGEPRVLNLFAYTGLATLALAGAGAAVTHVDGARSAVAWARRNAELADLAGRPIRWIVDDALAFTRREARRNRRYDGAVLDPPSYGHGPGGRPWRLEDDLPALLEAVSAVLVADAFVLLSAHTIGFDGDRLADQLASALGRRTAAIERDPLELATRDGRRLVVGAFGRSAGGA